MSTRLPDKVVSGNPQVLCLVQVCRTRHKLDSTLQFVCSYMSTLAISCSLAELLIQTSCTNECCKAG